MSVKILNNKAAIFLADGFEEIEALTVVDLMRRAHITCTTVSITDEHKVRGSHNIYVGTDEVIGSLDFDSYDMLILPGGLPGTTNLGVCKALTDQITAFCAAGKYIAAICAAPSVFAQLGLLKGKNAACNPARHDVLIENGANLLKKPVIQDDNIITSRAMGTAIPFGLKLVSVFKGEEAAVELGQGILYNYPPEEQ